MAPSLLTAPEFHFRPLEQYRAVSFQVDKDLVFFLPATLLKNTVVDKLRPTVIRRPKIIPRHLYLAVVGNNCTILHK
jgi:hypothetical protein